VEKYGGIVLQDLGAAIELDSSVPGERIKMPKRGGG